MSVILAVLGYWLLLSAVTTACFVWLRCTDRIRFDVREEPAPTIDDWLERRI